jgi:hypothetical protein
VHGPSEPLEEASSLPGRRTGKILCSLLSPTLPRKHRAAILDDLSPKEQPLSKRKPPSERPERKLDDTAKAIAHSREVKEPDKPRRSEGSTLHVGRLAKGITPRKQLGPAPSPSTKRPKKV